MDIKLFAASLRQDLPTLDLHGIYPPQALEQIEIFLYTVYQKKDSAARIICGIGQGTLLESVQAILRKHPLVENVVVERGSCIVTLSI